MELKKLLVVHDPTREEQPALELAAGIAGDSGASLHLFACIHGNESDGEAVKRQITAHKAALDALLAPIAARGIATSSEVDWDRDWHHAVVRAAARDLADMVFKGSFRRPGRHVLKTRSDSILIRECLCPVLLIRQVERQPVPKILAAIDIQAKAPPYKKLNRHVIDFCLRAVENTLAEVHVVNAFADFRFVPDRQRLMELAGVPSEQIHIKSGAPDKVIVDVARSIDASLVVVGNSHRSGLAALLHGNTAEKLLSKLDCNILAMP